MRTSRIKVIVALLFAFCLYATVWRLKHSEQFFERKETAFSTIFQRKGKVVILLSNQRSGSSFVGEFFNRFEKGFYLFEPLLPYTPSCARMYEERLELLKQISHCDFRNLLSSYSKAYQVLEVKSHRECMTKHLCFNGNHPTLLRRYSDLCKSVNEQYSGTANMTVLKNASQLLDRSKSDSGFLATSATCGFPLNMTLWSSLCYSAELVAYKILRVCSLSALEDITRQLTELGNEVYVIELVRDPRAIINSALKLELKMQVLDVRLDLLCGRYRDNIRYADEQTNAKTTSGIVASGRYMRVRYEDIAVDPVRGATMLYSYLGMDLPEEVKDWIKETSVSPHKIVEELKKSIENEDVPQEERDKVMKKIAELTREQRSPYGTARDPQEVLVKWRKKLPMNVVTRIQEKCGDVMTKMGYKLIQNEYERNDMSLQLW